MTFIIYFISTLNCQMSCGINFKTFGSDFIIKYFYDTNNTSTFSNFIDELVENLKSRKKIFAYSKTMSTYTKTRKFRSSWKNQI